MKILKLKLQYLENTIDSTNAASNQIYVPGLQMYQCSSFL